MKKILFVWFSVWSGLMVWASIKETDDNNSTTSIKDIFGKKHIYRQILINNDNWCIIHERYEFVKRPKPPKNTNQRVLPRKNQKNTKLT